MPVQPSPSSILSASVPLQQGQAAAASLERSRLDFLDLFKGIAAQLIVLHHLAFYGPMSDHARVLAPGLFDWLYEDARIAVQAFLVIGGFLAARTLCPQGLAPRDGLASGLLRRYLKLAPPFMAAILIAVLASAWASAWMDHDSISAPPQLPQLAAHALLLHGVLGYESLSAGAWYVAIDFQLYALASLLLALARSSGQRSSRWPVRPAQVLVAAGVAASLLFFNRDPSWDAWAPYFFGSYGMGMLAWWAGHGQGGAEGMEGRAARRLLCFMLLLALCALAFDFRSRIAVALALACLLAWCSRRGPILCGSWMAPLLAAGRISYAVFLVHFPVCLVVNAAFTRYAPAQPLVQAAGMVLAWAASLFAGLLFHRHVEIPLGKHVGRMRFGRAGHAVPRAR